MEELKQELFDLRYKLEVLERTSTGTTESKEIIKARIKEVKRQIALLKYNEEKENEQSGTRSI